jgi:hypothetical protein
MLEELLKNRLSYKDSLAHIKSLKEEGWIKTKEDLIDELNENEVVYINHEGIIKGLYQIGVCQFRRADGRWLTEYKQEFKSGKETSRMIPISGKLVFGSDIKKDMEREVAEEISVPVNGFVMYYVKTDLDFTTKSTFYPNVPRIMQFHHFEGELKKQYIKDEYIEYQEKKTNYYGWFTKKPNIV